MTLQLAATSITTGMTISYGDHHKHSRYLIVSAELPGFDLGLVALGFVGWRVLEDVRSGGAK